MLFSWGTVVYLSYQMDFDEDLPLSVRRVATIVPGVKLDEHKVGNAYHSIEWRFKMWALAFDPDSGYINDYTWGDGFGYSVYRERIRFTADAYGLLDVENDYRQYAYFGGWHSGVITAIHRTGYVGLALMLWFVFASLCVTYAVCKHMPKVKNRTYGLVYVVPAVASSVNLLLEHGYNVLFITFVFHASIAKLLYCTLRDEGYLVVNKGRKIYVPLLMRAD